MAINKNAPKQTLDPAVDAAMGDDPIFGGLNRKAIRRTDGEKAKVGRDAKRVKVTYDFPPELAALLESMAKAEGIPENQLAALLIMRGLDELEEGKISLRGYKIPSRVPRFAWFLDIAAEVENLRQHKRWQ